MTRLGIYDAIPYPYGWGVDKDDYINTLITDLEGLKAEYKKLNVQKLMDEGKGSELLKDEALDNITNQMGKIRDDVTG